MIKVRSSTHRSEPPPSIWSAKRNVQCSGGFTIIGDLLWEALARNELVAANLAWFLRASLRRLSAQIATVSFNPNSDFRNSPFGPKPALWIDSKRLSGVKPRPWLENNFVFPAKGKSAALDAVDSEVHLMNFGI
jgi:hypothetical protein